MDNDVLYRKRDGYIDYLPTGEKSYFEKMYGVYFIKMKIPVWFLDPKNKDTTPPKDFTRPGAQA